MQGIRQQNFESHSKSSFHFTSAFSSLWEGSTAWRKFHNVRRKEIISKIINITECLTFVFIKDLSIFA